VLPGSSLISCRRPSNGCRAGRASTGHKAAIAMVRPRRQPFEGRLQLISELPGSTFQTLLDRYGESSAINGRRHTCHRLTSNFAGGRCSGAATARAVANDHPVWEFILEAGRVWQEEGDGDFERASLPFTLEQRNANCMHNGVLTFLFRPDGAISHVAYEIGKETCAYFQFNAWGYFSARYTQVSLPNARQSANATGRRSRTA